MDWPDFDYGQFVFDHGIRIASILAGAYILVKILNFFKNRVVKRLASRHGKNHSVEKRIRTVGNVISNTGLVMIILTSIIMILRELGMDTSPVLTGAGIMGLAVSFGAQNFVRDLIGGLTILVENQYGEGDCIRVGQVEGEVDFLSLRKTVVRDKSGVMHHIPNGQIMIAGVLPSKKK